VVVIDDHRSFADALSVSLGQDERVDGCEAVASIGAALEILETQPADVVVVDAYLNGESGVVGTPQIRRRCPHARIVMVTGQPELDLLADAVRAGVDAFLAKAAPLADIHAAVLDDELRDDGSATLPAQAAEEIRRREEGRHDGAPVDLTPRERDVLALLSRGVLVKDIARLLGITKETCRGYIKSLLMKLDARSQLQAVVIATRMGLLRSDELEHPVP